MARRKKRKVFEAVEIIDAGAKGKAIAKAPDGKVIFINNKLSLSLSIRLEDSLTILIDKEIKLLKILLLNWPVW